MDQSRIGGWGHTWHWPCKWAVKGTNYPVTQKYWILIATTQGGADKSLARPTSRCRRAELIVSLERGVRSCAELQVFSCHKGWKEACQAMHAISTTWRPELSSSFSSCEARHWRKFTPSDRNITGTCTIICYHQKLGGPVKHCDFSTCDAPHPGNSDHPGDYWSNSQANLGRLPDFG